jgi:cold shock CspA family protein
VGPQPPERRGKPKRGKIAKLMVGQGHGFIRLSDNREVFFHRSDLNEGTSFNDFSVGDAVSFELLEDAVSGARALRVKKAR